jgi:photosystem II stability/assembly factor-like uncharacterized protein
MIWATEDGGQTWTKRKVGSTQDLEQIVCPSTRVCYVSTFRPGETVHEDLLITRNGGATWTRHTLTVTDQPVLALACPGIDDCYLSGLQIGPHRQRGIAMTHDGGGTWMVHTSRPASPSPYVSLACPTVNRCYAAGVGGLTTTDNGGRTWANRRLPGGGTNGSLPITCPTATICYFISILHLWRTSDGGTTWEQELSGGSGRYLRNVTCPAPTTCYAVGDEAMIVKTTDGLSWQEPTAYTRNDLNAIACPSATTCYAVGDAGTVLTTTDGGATWVRRSIGASAGLYSIASIACPTLDVCLAGALPLLPTGGVVLKTTDGGQTWQMEKQDMYATTITCPSLTVCVATGASGVLRTEDGGHTWATQPLPKGHGLKSIACPTTLRCVGVGGVPQCDTRPASQCSGRGWLFVTTDAGQHWRRQINRRKYLISVACPAPGQCYAGGFGIWARSTHGGRSWMVTHSDFAVANIIPKLSCTAWSGLPLCFISSLSCTGVSTCWGVAGQLYLGAGIPVRTTDGGRSWQSVARNVPIPTPNIFTGLLSLTCPRSNRCFAVGPGGLIMAYSP